MLKTKTMVVLKYEPYYMMLAILTFAMMNPVVSSNSPLTGRKERDATSNCEAGWEKLRDHCYLRGNEEISWTSARDKCKAKGADLVWIEDSYENSWVSALCGKSPRYRVGYCWIGAQDKDNVWKWCYNNENVVFTNWLRGQPDGGFYEQCAAMNYGSNVGMWQDHKCIYTYNYICKKPYIL